MPRWLASASPDCELIAMAQPQNYANHARRPPLLFLVAWSLATAATVGVGYRVVVDYSAETLALFR